MIRDDLLTCYHLLICVLDCICNNLLEMKRWELLNAECTILPKREPPKTEEGDGPPPPSYFSLRPYLCAKFDGINRDCETVYVNGFLPLMEQLVKDEELLAEGPAFMELMSPDNFEKNMYGTFSVRFSHLRPSLSRIHITFSIYYRLSMVLFSTNPVHGLVQHKSCPRSCSAQTLSSLVPSCTVFFSAIGKV